MMMDSSYSGKGALNSNGSVYICYLPPETNEQMLAEYFGTIGLLKKDKRTGRPKIWLYRDKITNEPKGDATVTYEDPHAALAAVEWFNNKDFHGTTIGVFIQESKSKDDQSYNSGNHVGDPPILGGDFGELEESARDMNGSGGRGRGRGDASGKAWQQEEDWPCPNTRSMASSAESWVREYNEAAKLADDINGMISERSSLSASGPEAQRHASAIRRKITILGTRLDSLQSLLAKLPGKQPLTEKEINHHKDMLANLRLKVNQMASTLNMSNFANRDSLLGPDKAVDAMSRTNGLDNYGVVGLQRQIMKEQDEGLEKLEETVISTKHIALAVNEELDLHTRLIDNLDQHVDVTDSRLQRVQRNLAILNQRTKGGCSCMCLLSSVIRIVALVVAIYLLVKYL